MLVQELLNSQSQIEQVLDHKMHQIWHLRLGEDHVIKFHAVWHTPVTCDFFFNDASGSVEKTGKGGELKVFAAAKQILTDILKEKKPNLITFEADKQDGKGNRADLYRRFLKRWTPAGYKFSEITDKYSANFYLKKEV